MSEISEIEIKSMTKEQNYMRGYEDGKSDVLDKIRAEIEHYNLRPSNYPCDMISIGTVLQIIDKYRNEEQGKENRNDKDSN